MPVTVSGRDPRTQEPINVHIDAGCIVAIEKSTRDESVWLTPGLIDLQVNGYHGDDLNSDDLEIETVQRLGRRLLRTGVTTFLPTLITAPEEKIIHNLRIIAAARDADPLLRHMIPCVHVEGPHISAEEGARGAHPAEHVRPPDLREFHRWQAACGGLVGLVTLSPHYAEAPEYIHELSKLGVHISIGHTNASPDQIRIAIDAGARLSTHLGNGVAAILPRHPNLIWAQLAEDRLSTSFIADGRHLPVDTLTAMLRAKTISRSILISDLVTIAGLPPGDYATPIGGRVVLHPDGRLNLAGTDYLAGATAALKDAVAHVATNTGFTLADAVQMATENPGRFAAGRGELRIGASADLLHFRWDKGCSTLDIEDIFLRGNRFEPTPPQDERSN